MLCREGIHTACYAGPTHEMYTDDFVREGRRLFAEAKAAVADDADLLARVEKAEFPLCFLQLERTPKEAFESGADVLFKRVVEREGIDKMTEWNAPHARDYIAKYEQMKQQ